MNRLESWIVNGFLRALAPGEREVVSGDLQELGLPGSRAAREVLGLVVRRQFAAWGAWQAWAALLVVALPLAMMLSLLSRQWANVAAFACWFYVDNWTPAYLGSPVARANLLDAIAGTLARCAALAAWAWSTGYGLAALSRRTAWTTIVLFALVLFAGTAGTTTVAARNPSNVAVFSSTFYDVGLPLLFRVVFVLPPATYGLCCARQTRAALAKSTAIAAGAIVLTGIFWDGPRHAALFGWWSRSADAPALAAMMRPQYEWALRLLPIGMLLPAIYVVSDAVRRRRRGGPASM